MLVALTLVRPAPLRVVNYESSGRAPQQRRPYHYRTADPRARVPPLGSRWPPARSRRPLLAIRRARVAVHHGTRPEEAYAREESRGLRSCSASDNAAAEGSFRSPRIGGPGPGRRSGLEGDRLTHRNLRPVLCRRAPPRECQEGRVCHVCHTNQLPSDEERRCRLGT